ncbi:retrovirus-related pol polyprotein from transposon TNT 1-94 [Tanacetum coccineum]|uniref:Retrovirus-related pol polyprotein from transposon TNT 1-94 n=1 Tax=Tanacetum coccineum TaxID=301880 RepID=A0ABQ4XYJ5_9ASTR
MIASSESRKSSKNMPRFSSNDMVHNHYLDEARKKTQERDRNSKTSVMPSARFQSTTDGSKPKPRSNNQTSRSFPVSKSIRVTITVVPKADHSKSSTSFSDSKYFFCSTCHKCVFNANHDACITKLLKEVNSRAKSQSHETSPVPEGQGMMTGEPATEARVNGGITITVLRLGEIDMSVKMRTTCTWTERPYEASLFPGIGFGNSNKPVEQKSHTQKPVEQKSHTQKPGRQIFTGHRFSPNKTSVVYEKTSPRSDLSALESNTYPKTFKEDIQDPRWCEAMDSELKALEDNDTWEVTDLPPNKRAIGCHWLFKTKLKSDGSEDKKKARSLLAVASMQGWDIVHMDVSNAFLHGDLFEEVYMKMPLGYVGKGEKVKNVKNDSPQVCKLKKSRYGLKQAPRQWFSKLFFALLSFGFKQSKADYSLFTKEEGESFIVVLVYVDDLMITGNNNALIQKFKSQLSSTFYMKDLVDLHYFLGLEVTKSEYGLFVSQKSYTLELLQEARVMTNKPYKLPMDPNLKLQAEMGTPLQDPEAIKHLLRYLLNAPGQGILLAHHSKVKLTAYCDSDWASCPMTRRSTTGYCILLGDSPISWKSKKQDLGLKDLHLITLHCDNQAAIHIAANPVFHARTKHIEVDCHYVRDQVKEGAIRPEYILTT